MRLCNFLLNRGKLLKCSGCQYVYYCGKLCQIDAWNIHKMECRGLRRIAPRVLPDSARLLARLIFILRKGGDQVKSYYSEGSFRMFKDLMSRKQLLFLFYFVSVKCTILLQITFNFSVVFVFVIHLLSRNFIKGKVNVLAKGILAVL